MFTTEMLVQPSNARSDEVEPAEVQAVALKLTCISPVQPMNLQAFVFQAIALNTVEKCLRFRERREERRRFNVFNLLKQSARANQQILLRYLAYITPRVSCRLSSAPCGRCRFLSYPASAVLTALRARELADSSPRMP